MKVEVRRVVREFEADLYRVPEPRFFRRKMGELERTAYAGGEARLKISFSGVGAPDGSLVEVLLGGEVIHQCNLEGGRYRIKLSTSQGHSIPEVAKGDVVEVRVDGEVVLRGRFRPD